MSKNKNLLKLLSPGDILTVALILIGIFVAIFMDVTALRLIGAGIGIIGIISFVMVISKRMGDFVDSRFKSNTPAPNFKVTTKTDSTATRKTIEGFKEEIEKDSTNQGVLIQEIKSPPTNTPQSFDDGFRIVGKVKSESKSEGKTIANETRSENLAKSIKSEREANLQKNKPSNDTKEDSIAESESLSKTIEIPEEINENTAQYINKKIDLTLNHLMEEAPPHGDEPRKEFEYCLYRILLAVRSVSNTKTVSFLLYNHRTGEIKLDAHLTDTPELINTNMKFKSSTDIISQILSKAKPEILAEINPNAVEDLIPYYNCPVEIGSFIGVPVFYRGDTIGIICADSSEGDAFDRIIVNFLGHFTQLIATLIGSYIEKYDLIQSAQILETISNFNNLASSNEANPSLILKELRESSHNILEPVVSGTISWDYEKAGWNVCGITSEGILLDKLIGSHIDESSLIAHSINRRATLLVESIGDFDCLANTGEVLPAFSHCLAIPIICSDTNFGALFILSRGVHDITPDDTSLLTRLCVSSAQSLQRLNMLQTFQTGSVYQRGGAAVLNSSGFTLRLEEEMDKAKDLANLFCLVLISVDHYDALQSEIYDERKRLINHKVEQIIIRMKRSFDVFARSEPDIYAVILNGFDEQKAKFWAEKIKNEIALAQLEFSQKQFNITISASVVSSNLASSSGELYSYGREALVSAIAESNCVLVFS